MIEKVRPAKGMGSPYDNPALFANLDSLEGLPDLLGPGETEAEREGWADWQRRGNERFAALGAVVPGLVLAAAVAGAGAVIAEWPTTFLGLEKTPLSPILVAIALGLLIRNAVGLPKTYEPGLALALRRVLRIGVALLGLRLSLGALGALGLVALPIVALCILSALFFVTRLGRLVGLPPRLATLIAVGTAICGNTAIVALAPVIGAEDDEVSYAVGCITLFGLIALVVHPFVAHALFDGEALRAGLFLGTAIHDTAQVAGAGLVYLVQYGTPDALEAATVTKLLRNAFMLVVIPGVAWLHQRRTAGPATRASLRQALPLFVFGFLALSVVRSVGDLGDRAFGLLDRAQWEMLIAGATDVASFCLAVAMASVGLGTSLVRLRGLGWPPLAVALVAAVLVGGVAFGAIVGLDALGFLATAA